MDGDVGAWQMIAAGLLLMVFLPWGMYLRERRHHKTLIRQRRAVEPFAALPREQATVEPHLDHRWTDGPVGYDREWAVFACTVPGCPARDFRRGSAMWNP